MMVLGNIIGQVNQSVSAFKPPKLRYSYTMCLYYTEYIADFS